MALTDSFIQEQKQKLVDKRTRTLEEINRLKKQSPANDPDTKIVDEDDDVQEEISYDEITQKINELNGLITQIDKALDAMSQGTYGLDEETKEPISIERLKAYPEATTTV